MFNYRIKFHIAAILYPDVIKQRYRNNNKINTNYKEVMKKIQTKSTQRQRKTRISTFLLGHT
jgi:hypothetical protein